MAEKIEQAVTVRGRTFRVVANNSPGLAVGVATPIYQRPFSREDFEEIGVIREIKEQSTDTIRARVEFPSEPGQSYWRFICKM